MVSIIQCVNVMYHIGLFADTEKSSYPWDKSHLIIVCDPFNVLLESVCLLRIFASMFINDTGL